MLEIIGISGKARSGKDTVASEIQGILEAQSGVNIVRYNYADPLKAFVMDWLGWDREHGWGSLKETILIPNFSLKRLEMMLFKHFSDHPSCGIDERSAPIFAKKFQDILIKKERLGNFITESGNKVERLVASPRELFQWVGTDLMRDCAHNSFWVNYLDKFENFDGVLLVADVRIENEASKIRSMGGRILHIERPECQQVAAHSSEDGIAVLEEDKTIVNDTTLEQLSQNVLEYLREETLI